MSSLKNNTNSNLTLTLNLTLVLHLILTVYITMLTLTLLTLLYEPIGDFSTATSPVDTYVASSYLNFVIHVAS